MADRWRWLALATLAPAAALAEPPPVPVALARHLPAGFTVMAVAEAHPDPTHAFTFVALAAKTEVRKWGTTSAPPRPLIVFEKLTVGYRQVARNDQVVLRADEGGQCDPFEDGGITAKGAYVTIENSVACGQHWSDYITFRFDRRRGGYVFDNQRYQSWEFNPDHRPDAEALVRDVDHIERAKGRVIPLSRWRRRD